MKMNKFHFNEHKQDTWKCDWLIGHIISIHLEHVNYLDLLCTKALEFIIHF